MLHKLNLKESSNIEQALYNQQTSQLTVTFRSGLRYRYYQIPQIVIDDWQQNTPKFSAGNYFHHQIKCKGFKYERVTDKNDLKE